MLCVFWLKYGISLGCAWNVWVQRKFGLDLTEFTPIFTQSTMNFAEIWINPGQVSMKGFGQGVDQGNPNHPTVSIWIQSGLELGIVLGSYIEPCAKAPSSPALTHLRTPKSYY